MGIQNPIKKKMIAQDDLKKEATLEEKEEDKEDEEKNPLYLLLGHNFSKVKEANILKAISFKDNIKYDHIRSQPIHSVGYSFCRLVFQCIFAIIVVLQ